MDFAHCVAVKCIYVFLLFPEVQKCYVFRHCARLFVYLCIYLFYFQKSRNVMFSGTVRFARQVHLSGQFLKLFCIFCYTWVYIKKYGRSTCLAMNRVGYFRIIVLWYHRYDGHNCIVVASTPETYAIILASLNAAKCPSFWCYGNGHPKPTIYHVNCFADCLKQEHFSEASNSMIMQMRI